MTEFVQKYWPSLAGVVVVLVIGILVWPRSEPPSVTRVEPTSTARARSVVQPLQREEREEEEEGEREAEDTDSPFPPGRTEFLETVVAVPLPSAPEEPQQWSQDDPQVKAALSQVKLELYEAPSCVACEEARRFFDQNQLSFQAHDVKSDSWIEETLRRRAGTIDVPVVFVDGQAVRGFNADSFQAALTVALQKRLGKSQREAF
jgi:glutaredoxin